MAAVIVAGALALALGFGAVPPVAANEADAAAWREMHLSAERRAGLVDELARALQHRWRKRLLDIDVSLVGPRIMTDGRAYRLVADGGRIDIKSGTIGDLPITGSIELQALAVDYATLGLGRLEVVGDTRIRPSVDITLDQLDRLLRKSGFVETTVQWNEAAERITLNGVWPVRLLMFKLRPRFRVTGRFHVEDRYVMRLDRVRIDVSGVLGFLARLVLSRAERRCAQTIDLRKDYEKLRRQNIRIAGGSVTLRGPHGAVKQLEFPPDPTLTVDDGDDAD